MKLGKAAASATQWRAFVKRYRGEMAATENARTLDLLAALSHQTNFSVGCYCADEARCHRAVLKALLIERGAAVIEDRHPEGAGE